jgi:amidohydrolase
LRAQDNGVMEELIEKVKRSIEAGAATVGAKATVTVKGGVPAAEYDLGLVKVAREAIARVLGANGVLDPIVSPGGEDFHFFAKKIPGFVRLTSDWAAI